MASRMSCPWFVGRTEELRQLIVALQATIAGSSATVLVGGDAGIGKSRLVAELSKRARAAGAVVVTGQCLDVADGGAPYAPVHEVLARLGSSGAERPGAAGGGAARGAAPRRRRTPGRGRHRGRPLGGPLEQRDLLTLLAGGPELSRVMLVATYRADQLTAG